MYIGKDDTRPGDVIVIILHIIKTQGSKVPVVDSRKVHRTCTKTDTDKVSLCVISLLVAGDYPKIGIVIPPQVKLLCRVDTYPVIELHSLTYVIFP